MPTRSEIDDLIASKLASVSDITAVELREVNTSIADYIDEQGALVVFVATKAEADALTLKQGRLVRVAVDVENNNDKSMYLSNGTTLEFQYTIA